MRDERTDREHRRLAIDPGDEKQILEIALELEEMAPDAVRGSACELRTKVRPGRRLAFAVVVGHALWSLTSLTLEERMSKLTAWCQGLNVSEADVLRKVPIGGRHHGRQGQPHVSLLLRRHIADHETSRR
jgi:hypothetical protein